MFLGKEILNLGDENDEMGDENLDDFNDGMEEEEKNQEGALYDKTLFTDEVFEGDEQEPDFD